MVPHATLGGPDGMRISRATFAVMIKFSDMMDDLQSFIDEVDMILSTITDQTQLETSAKEQLKLHPGWDHFFKRWESASKMRQWIIEKKKNLIERIKKEVETEYTKKK